MAPKDGTLVIALLAWSLLLEPAGADAGARTRCSVTPTITHMHGAALLVPRRGDFEH
jgi:hypothetical protein